MKDSIFIVMEFYFTIQLLLGFLQSLMVVLVFLNATCFGGIFKSSMLKCNLWIHLLLFSCILCLGTSIFLFLCLSLFLLSIPFFLPFPFFFLVPTNFRRSALAEYFQNKLVDTIHFMDILNLKDSVEKDTFFRKLPNLAEQLPRQIVLKKVWLLISDVKCHT